MVQNREELLAAVQSWMQQASNDLRGHLENFMNTQDVTLEELSEVLSIPFAELESMANGDANVSLSSFAKLLIANGMAIQIIPVGATPIGSYRGPRHGTRRGGFNPMPTDQFGRPLPPMGPFGRPMTPPAGGFVPGAQVPFNGAPRAMENPNMQNGPQPRGANGQFIRRPQAGDAVGGAQDPYMRLSADALKDIITRNNWHYEIDLNQASREDMIAFLKAKETAGLNRGKKTNVNQPQVHAGQPQVHAEQPQAPVAEQAKTEEQPANDKAAKLIGALTKFFTDNPDAGAAVFDSMNG